MAALFARLREEVRKGAPRSGGGVDRAQVRLRARSQAGRVWPVSAEQRIVHRPGLYGTLVRPLKAVLRRLMRWYVEPFAADQRSFNDAVLKLIDDLYERLDEERATGAPLSRPDRSAYADELRGAEPVLELGGEPGEALAALAGREDASLGGILAGGVAERLPLVSLLELLSLAAAKLRPGGVLVVETPGRTGSGQPLVSEVLAALVREAGFAWVEARPLREPAGAAIVART